MCVCVCSMCDDDRMHIQLPYVRIVVNLLWVYTHFYHIIIKCSRMNKEEIHFRKCAFWYVELLVKRCLESNKYRNYDKSWRKEGWRCHWRQIWIYWNVVTLSQAFITGGTACVDVSLTIIYGDIPPFCRVF